MSGSRIIVGLLVVALLAAAGDGEAQRRGGGGRGFGRMRLATPRTPTARSISAASRFRAAVAAAGASTIRGPTSISRSASPSSPSTRVSFDDEREPNHVVVRLTDDELFQCPFIMMTEVGTLYLDDEEAERLRDYLLKGGFLWADDFWGSYAWQNWENEIRKVLPRGAVSDRRSAARPSALPRAVRRAEGAADPVDQLLDGKRRRHLGARQPTAPCRRCARSSTSTAGRWC